MALWMLFRRCLPLFLVTSLVVFTAISEAAEPVATIAEIAQWDPVQVRIGGEGITSFSFSKDGGPYSDPLPMDTVIPLDTGAHTLRLVGATADGEWQLQDRATPVEWSFDSLTSWKLVTPSLWIQLTTGAPLPPRPEVTVTTAVPLLLRAMPATVVPTSLAAVTTGPLQAEDFNVEDTLVLGGTTVSVSANVDARNVLVNAGSLDSTPVPGTQAGGSVTINNGSGPGDLIPITGPGAVILPCPECSLDVDHGAGIIVSTSVMSFFPRPAATDVSVAAPIMVLSDAPFTCSSIGPGSILLNGPDDTVIAGTVACSDHGVTFSPAVLLQHGATYTVSLLPSFWTALGSAAVSVPWSFTTSTDTSKAVINLNAGFGGTMAIDGDASVFRGERRTVTITPDAGYHVSGVSINGKPSGARRTYRLNRIMADTVVTATFARNRYTVSTKSGRGGTITADSTAEIYHGDARSYAITPEVGYDIRDVIVDRESRGGTTSVSFPAVTENHRIKAVFAKKTYAVSAIQAAHGTISGGGTVVHGGARTLVFRPERGYRVKSVIVDGEIRPAAPKMRLSPVTSDVTVTAEFEPVT